MTERLLHFIWQFQYFNKSELTTSTGEVVQIFFAGQYNTNQGPDFSAAKIKIGNTAWAGTVELHLKTSDWKKHNHQTDKNYNNVVLHVVWENDEAHLISAIPIIELKERISTILLSRYEEVNADAFEAMAKSISINILAKHKGQIHWIESLLLGQAGLLEKEFDQDYPKLLQNEYKFLKEKYKLKPIHHPIHFLRMRPGNFPSIRLAQLAILITESAHLFSKIKEAATVSEVKEWFDVTANDYWHYHYRLDDESSFKKKNLGANMVNNIIINTVAPVLFAYGNYHDENKYKEKARQWLEETRPEENSITKGFQLLKIENKNACDSQALIELKNQYCNNKRCLECGVGNSILKS